MICDAMDRCSYRRRPTHPHCGRPLVTTHFKFFTFTFGKVWFFRKVFLTIPVDPFLFTRFSDFRTLAGRFHSYLLFPPMSRQIAGYAALSQLPKHAENRSPRRPVPDVDRPPTRVHHQRARSGTTTKDTPVGYNAWIEDTNGNAIDESP